MSIRDRWNSLRRRSLDRLARRFCAAPVENRAGRPLVSVAFDDIPRSAAVEGGRALLARGMRGTYFVAGGLEGGIAADGEPFFTRDDLQRLAATGHEIGCHTFSHHSMPRLNSAQVLDELARNRDYLASRLGEAPIHSFAYPYGDTCPRTKRIVRRHFALARGVYHGINEGAVDIAQLRTLAIETCAMRWPMFTAALDRAVATNAWVVLVTHDVRPRPGPWGATPADIARVLDEVQRRGIEVATMAQAHAAILGTAPAARQRAA
jgi:peptidoglycan/xylan/chitin deacetylase (PgdA/CDA1 family)